jgi:DNA-binding CsgD family transcriptional regulator
VGGDRDAEIEALLGLAQVALAQWESAQARRCAQEALTTVRAIKSLALLARCLECLACVEAAQDRPQHAARWWGAADALRAELGTPKYPVERASDELARAQARRALGEPAFRVAWAEGRRLTPEQVQEQALSTRETQSSRGEAPPNTSSTPLSSSATLSSLPLRPATRTPYGLTARELEVLRWVAEGLSDAQIAERLVISLRTVNRHTTVLYSKLGVSSRAAATRVALERHLLADPRWDLPATHSPSAESKT